MGTQKINYPEQVNGTIPAGGTGLGIIGQDDGVFVATGTILNVTGQRGSLSASGTVLNLVFSPDPQEFIGVYGLNNGVPLGTGTWMDFGNNLSASISGTVIRVNATGGGSTGTTTIQDEGITQGNASTLNFVGTGVQATVAGTVATITITGSSGGSTPTDVPYVIAATGTYGSNLPSGIYISGLAGSADRSYIGGAGFSQEFNSSYDPFTWTFPPPIFNSNQTVPSHYYATHTTGTINYGMMAWNPSTGSFDVRSKMLFAQTDTGSTTIQFSMVIGASSHTTDAVYTIITTGVLSATIRCFTKVGGTGTQRGSTITVYGKSELYLRISRDTSNNISFWWSENGIVWQLIAKQSFTLDVAKAGFYIFHDANIPSTPSEMAIDWFRSSV